MVDQVLQDDDAAGGGAAPGGRQQFVGAGQGGPVHRREGATVQVEARELLEDFLGRGENGDGPAVGRARGGFDGPGQARQVALGHEEGAGGVPRVQGARDDAGGLGHVQAALGLQAGAQLHVLEARVVVQAGVGGQVRAGEGDEHRVLRAAGGRGRGRRATSAPRR